MNHTETDVSSLVNAVFEEAECASECKETMPCGGEVRAYATSAHCSHGFLCETHLNNYLNVLRPLHVASFQDKGWLRCSSCGYFAQTVDAYSRVVVL